MADQLAVADVQTIISDDMKDTFPFYAVGMTALLTVVWWFVLLFAYVKNHTNDVNLTNLAGEEVFPIQWFWERLNEQTDIYVYIAIALLWGFSA